MLSQPLPRRRLLTLFVKSSLWLTATATSTQLVGCDSDLPGKQKPSDSEESLHVHDTKFGKLLVIDQSRAQVLFAFAEVCVSNAREAISRARVIQRLDEELYFVSASIRDDFLLALDALEYLPIVYGRFSRFSKMNLADREALLTSLQQTRINAVSAVLNACRMAVMMMYYGHESTWAGINYDGTFSRAPQILSLQRQQYQQLTRSSGA